MFIFFTPSVFNQLGKIENQLGKWSRKQIIWVFSVYFFIIYLIKFIFKNCLHHCCIELKGQVRKGTTHCQWYLADLHVLQGTNLDHY